MVHTIAVPASDGGGIAIDPTTDTVYLTGVDGLSTVAFASRSSNTGSSNLLWVAGGVMVIVVVSGGAAFKRRRAAELREAHDSGL
ncbi:hypothetical protein FEAC_29700 [Ferrimicrobium acidiphilum DSM 19497]|uniref:Uncharacterized protein n=1 Tax=Ferrimicrobium acidiphilum DSM 19497 TaxID=1121877 RepID=A0A0D8FQS9_9ACTN|nr:hypothetical protein FEAC_29700 [Ferrimicrobium acidiphilum DSM 19497]